MTSFACINLGRGAARSNMEVRDVARLRNPDGLCDSISVMLAATIRLGKKDQACMRVSLRCAHLHNLTCSVAAACPFNMDRERCEAKEKTRMYRLLAPAIRYLSSFAVFSRYVIRAYITRVIPIRATILFLVSLVSLFAISNTRRGLTHRDIISTNNR